MGRDVRFAHSCVGFSETFDHAGDHEITAEFDGIGLPWLGPGYEPLAADRLGYPVGSGLQHLSARP